MWGEPYNVLDNEINLDHNTCKLAWGMTDKTLPPSPLLYKRHWNNRNMFISNHVFTSNSFMCVPELKCIFLSVSTIIYLCYNNITLLQSYHFATIIYLLQSHLCYNHISATIIYLCYNHISLLQSYHSATIIYLLQSHLCYNHISLLQSYISATIISLCYNHISATIIYLWDNHISLQQ